MKTHEKRNMDYGLVKFGRGTQRTYRDHCRSRCRRCSTFRVYPSEKGRNYVGYRSPSWHLDLSWVSTTGWIVIVLCLSYLRVCSRGSPTTRRKSSGRRTSSTTRLELLLLSIWTPGSRRMLNSVHRVMEILLGRDIGTPGTRLQRESSFVTDP